MFNIGYHKVQIIYKMCKTNPFTVNTANYKRFRNTATFNKTLKLTGKSTIDYFKSNLTTIKY